MAMSGSDDFDVSFFRPGFDDLVEGFVIRRTAIGIAGTVLLDGANIDFSGSQHLGPTYGGGQEMRVAKGNIGDRDIVADGLTNGRRWARRCFRR